MFSPLKSIIPGGDAGWVPGLYHALKGFDVVHLHYPFYGGAEFVWLARLLRGQKYIVTYHMVAKPTQWYQQIVQSIYDFLFTKTILKNAEKVLVVDKNYFGKIKAEELPNGIDTSLFSPADTLAEPNQFLFVGNLMPVKGLDILLQALTKVPDAKLTVVGSGYSEALYKKMTADLGLSGRVSFVGSVSHTELPKYYRTAWATIVPSRAESFSLVTLESMACGTPVVAFKIPGIENKIENGVDGWLVDVGKISAQGGSALGGEDLRLKILDLMKLNEVERKRMGERGSLKVQKKFSMEKHVEQLLQIYSQVV